jgi:alanyl-tRNA synthetase
MCAVLYLQLVGVVVKTFGEAYPELAKHQEKIHAVISEEEASFSRTLGKGIERFKKLAAAAQVGCLVVLFLRATCDLLALCLFLRLLQL